MQFVNDHKANPDDHFKAHFTLQAPEKETPQEVTQEVSVKETKKETKPKAVATDTKVNETENKEQQFNV